MLITLIEKEKFETVDGFLTVVHALKNQGKDFKMFEIEDMLKDTNFSQKEKIEILQKI